MTGGYCKGIFEIHASFGPLMRILQFNYFKFRIAATIFFFHAAFTTVPGLFISIFYRTELTHTIMQVHDHTTG